MSRYTVTIVTADSTTHADESNIDAVLEALGDEPFGITVILQVVK